jgi:hypothetical protein
MRKKGWAVVMAGGFAMVVSTSDANSNSPSSGNRQEDKTEIASPASDDAAKSETPAPHA